MRAENFLNYFIKNNSSKIKLISIDLHKFPQGGYPYVKICDSQLYMATYETIIVKHRENYKKYSEPSFVESLNVGR